MAAIYIREQGTTVTKRDERIVVIHRGQTILDRPVFNIENVALFGNVQISTQAAAMLMERGTDIGFFTYSGKYIGHMAADSSKNIFLRMQQNEYYRDLEKRMQTARIIVGNKIRNQKTILEQFRWDTDYPWKEDTNSLQHLLEKLPGKDSTSAIMGIEGAASNVYFKSYAQMFKSEIRFPGRNRRPPRDPINIILSLGYTLLTREVESALEAESFETYLGFLHGIRYGRKSLALDLVEEFRQPVIDRLVLRLFNKGMIGNYDFKTEGNRLPVLTEEGFRKFCRSYERWMTGQDKAAGDKSFRQRIRQQTAELKHAIKDERDYVPFAWREADTECT